MGSAGFIGSWIIVVIRLKDFRASVVLGLEEDAVREFAGEGCAVIQSAVDGVDQFDRARVEVQVGETLLKLGNSLDSLSVRCEINGLQILESAQGFIEFVVAPLIVGFINILPALNSIGDTMVENMANWGRLRKEEIQGSEMENKDEEVDKLDARVEKFNSTMSFLGTLKDSCS